MTSASADGGLVVGHSTTGVVALLRTALGDGVVTDQSLLEAMRTDKSGHVSDSAPFAIVTARSTAGVQATMCIVNADFRREMRTIGHTQEPRLSVDASELVGILEIPIDGQNSP